jgi:hypothetical protein
MECVPNTIKTQINTYKCKNKYSHSWQTKTMQENHAQNVHINYVFLTARNSKPYLIPSSPPVFSGIQVTQSLVLRVCFCRSLFVLCTCFYKCKNKYSHSWQTKTMQENHAQNVHVITKVQFAIKTDKATTVEKNTNFVDRCLFFVLVSLRHCVVSSSIYMDSD